jgi:hypothetical protein
MLRHQLYLDRHDQITHLNQMQRLATDLQRPIPEIVPVYEDVLEDLRAYAQIPDFLPVIVSKKVRERYRKND